MGANTPFSPRKMEMCIRDSHGVDGLPLLHGLPLGLVVVAGVGGLLLLAVVLHPVSYTHLMTEAVSPGVLIKTDVMVPPYMAP